MTGRRTAVVITHPDRVLFPEEGYTKRDVADFYDRVFPRLKPWVDDRLLSLERCPEGLAGECFFQKQAPAGLPPGTKTKSIRHEKGVTRYVVGGARETQLALANLGCIAVHVWGSRASAPRQPDWVCFDLDPGRRRFRVGGARRPRAPQDTRPAGTRLVPEDLGREGPPRLRAGPPRSRRRRRPGLRPRRRRRSSPRPTRRR